MGHTGMEPIVTMTMYALLADRPDQGFCVQLTFISLATCFPIIFEVIILHLIWLLITVLAPINIHVTIFPYETSRRPCSHLTWLFVCHGIYFFLCIIGLLSPNMF